MPPVHILFCHANQRPRDADEERAFAQYISEQTARIRASWSEITHRRRASGLTGEEIMAALEWRPPLLMVSEDEIFG